MRQTRKQSFEPPRCRAVGMCVEQSIMVGSVVDAMNDAGVKSAAQELEQYDASAASFNHEWE